MRFARGLFEPLDEPRVLGDLEVELAIGFLEIGQIGVEPAVGGEEGAKVFGVRLDVGDGLARAAADARREIVDEALVRFAVGRFDDDDERCAAPHPAELMLVRAEAGAVAGQELEQIRAYLDARRVNPGRRHQQEGREEEREWMASARVDQPTNGALEHHASPTASRISPCTMRARSRAANDRTACARAATP